MAEFYDRQGREMTLDEWSKSYESMRTDRRVASTVLPDGKWISTVWLGINHSYGDGPPLIFETLVFPSDRNMSDLDGQRYSTEAEALDGHAALVEKWSKPIPAEALKG